MCPGSPRRATGARATSQQPLERVNAGRVAVAPIDPDAVGSYQSYAHRTDVGRYGCRIEKRCAAHLLDARCAGTCQPQRASRIEGIVPVLVPFDLQPVVLAIDGVGYGVQGYWLLAIGYDYWLWAMGYWLN